jgi:acyl carrier protein
MTDNREQRLEHLRQFLRGIQKPSKPIGNVGIDESLVESGLIDSLAIVQIVTYLEETYGMDFSARGLDPETLASMASILALIDQASSASQTSS